MICSAVLLCYDAGMFEVLNQYGLPALFLVSFLASTLLPLGSEWLLVALLVEGHGPTQTVLVATLGNTLGSVTDYLIGYYGREWFVQKLLRLDTAQLDRAGRWFDRYGSWALLLAWLPVVGDPLCVVSGMLKTPPGRFTLLVAIGKGLRYSFLAVVTLEAGHYLT